MSRYFGDIVAGQTIRLPINTNTAAGAPITLAGSPVAAAYKDGGTTESTAGVTLTVDFDGRTGLHAAVVDTAADGTFYSAGSDFRVVLTAGTVDSVSVVGALIGTFSIENRSRRVTSVDANALTASALAADAVAEIAAGITVPTAAANADAIWDALVADHNTANTFGALVGVNLDAAITSRMATFVYTAPDNAGILAAIADVEAAVGDDTPGTTTLLTRVPGTIQPQTGDSFARLGAPAGASIAADIAGVTAPTAAEIFTAVWTTALTESYAADGVAPTPAQVMFLISQGLLEFAIAGTTLTVKKLDGSTTAATYTLDSATAPTSRTRAT